MGGLRAAVAIVAASAAALLAFACDDEPRQPSHAPATVEEFFEALRFGLEEDGRPYHATVAFTQLENGQHSDISTVEAWLDLRGAEGRWEYRKGVGNTADVAAHVVTVYTGGALYRANLDDDGEKPDRFGSGDLRQCFPEAPSYLLSEMTCGFLPMEMVGWDRSVETGSFEGRSTVVLLLTKATLPRQFPTDVPTPPGGWPTPPPILAAASQAELRFHIDAVSYLPVAITQAVDTDRQRTSYGGLMRFESGFIERSDLPGDAFSPAALGYVEPREEERRILEDPALQARVYWLGRTFAPGGGLPNLGDLYVESYGPPGRPKSDAPQIQAALTYMGQGGRVVLRLFKPGDWETFKERLGGNFPWSWCGESREFTVGDAEVTLLAAHESFPYDERAFGQPTILRPGETPPTPDTRPPPLKTDPCPSTPHDRFMAEVRFPDATVVINGPLGYGGQDGSPYGVYDSAEGLEAVARALRPRQPGE